MRRIWGSLTAAFLAVSGMGMTWAQDSKQDVEELKRQVEDLNRKVTELESRGIPAPAVRAEQGQPGQQPPPQDEKTKEALQQKGQSKDVGALKVGSATMRLIDVSLDVLFTGGFASERDAEIATLQAGGHDPNKRGFSLTQAEISLAGAVDPYFTAEAHIVFFINDAGETEVELEEAFLKTLDLPAQLQLKAGHFLTEFGRINPTHPHAWRWIDQPVVNSRMFGADGLRAPGVRMSWLAPLPIMSEVYVGMQMARGETVSSFFGEDGGASVGNYTNIDFETRSMRDFLYFLRWENGFDISDSMSSQVGVSALIGPNATGGHGSTYIYGLDLVFKWLPPNNQRGWPAVIFETEIIGRHFKVDREDQLAFGHPGVGSSVLKDWGFYTQVLWNFTTPWSAGLRYEIANGGGTEMDTPDPTVPSSVVDHRTDPFRDKRYRLSPLLMYRPSEFSRLRLQYNFDRAEHIPNGNHRDHAVWLSVEFLIGTHPAHKY
jgi:hypothetical protein